MRISQQDYSRCSERYDGYCPVCDALTTLSVEPDAEERKCFLCEERNVMGMDSALLQGYIEIDERARPIKEKVLKTKEEEK